MCRLFVVRYLTIDWYKSSRKKGCLQIGKKYMYPIRNESVITLTIVFPSF